MPWFRHMLDGEWDYDEYCPKPFIHKMFLNVIEKQLGVEGVGLYKIPNDDITSILESSSWKKSVIDCWTEWNPEYVAQIKKKNR